jgi:hypothetical protein
MGTRLLSQDTNWSAEMQTDGNFVVCQKGVPKWSTGRQTVPVGVRIVKTSPTAILGMYNGTTLKYNFLGSNISKFIGIATTKLVMQNGGNLVWSTNTNVELWKRIP